MDERRERILSVLGGTYGTDAQIWFQRWRVFFMACAGLFGTNNGNEWFVSHYLLRRV